MPKLSPEQAQRLTPDCSACAALCCVALDLPQGPSFAITKPAGQPCPNLCADGQCRIHPTLAAQGFSGCAAYDCKGAGQAVTATLFKGQLWQAQPSLLPAMSEAFYQMLRVHAALELLWLCQTLTLSEPQETERLQLLARLDPAEGWQPETLSSPQTNTALRHSKRCLASLRDCQGIAALNPNP